MSEQPIDPDGYPHRPTAVAAGSLQLTDVLLVLDALIPVAQYVSHGRGFVDVEKYPDATARRALGLAADAGLLDWHQ